MELIRHYCMIPEGVADIYGFPAFVTFGGVKGDRYRRQHMIAIQISDYVIECDNSGNSRYIKNRREPHQTAKVDPDELVWLKLASVEIEE